MPVAVDTVDVSTPVSRAALLLGLLSYLIVLATLMGGLYLAIDSTAGERERGSLEALLTTPMARAQILYGKILATSSYMLLSLMLTVTACAVAALTVYDMLKAASKGLVISQVRLLHKAGGKSGEWRREQ